MKSLTRSLQLATLWLLLSFAAVVHAASSVVVDWDNAALQAIRNTKPGPPIVARALAIVHTAMYDAWAAYDPVAVGTRLGAALRRPMAERTEANKQKAISFAAYRALVDLFPSEKPFFDGLMTSSGYNPNDTTSNAATPSGIGNVAAKAVIDFRHQDGANQLGDRSPGAYSDYTGYQSVNTPDAINDPNRWQPLRLPNGSVQTFVAPHWQNVIAFALTSASQFRPGAPTQFGSAAYQAQAQEIIDLTANLDDRRKTIAEYWADGPSSELPPGHWCLFAQVVSRRDNHTLDADVKLFFALTNALFDASIAAWDAKRAYDSVRPITAVRFLFRNQLIQGVNGQSVLGQDWRPYQPSTFPTPPFAEYTSGHSTFSAAAAEVLKSFTGSDAFNHSVTMLAGSSRIELGVPKQDVTLSWATFSEAADEAGLSRRLGGIHFEDGDLQGRATGRKVGAQAWTSALTYFDGTQSAPPPQPLPPPSEPDPCADATFDHDKCMEQGGGCAVQPRAAFDPVLPLLVAAAWARLRRREKRLPVGRPAETNRDCLTARRLLLVAVALVPLAAAAQSPEPLSLQEALRVAQGRSPQLTAQSAAISAAESLIVSAGQRPDPQLGIGIENLPVDGADAFSVGRDFMTMRKIGISQQFTRAAKLQARAAKAVAERNREQAKLAGAQTDVRREVALAWLDRYFIEQRLRVLRDLERETALLAEAARAALAGGKGSPADPIVARTARVQVQDRIQEIERDLRRAHASLARYVGESEATRALDRPPSFYVLPHVPNEFLQVLEHHPQLLVYAPAEAIARADIAEAQAAKQPDWSIELAYAQRGSSFSNMLTIQARVDLPMFSKQRQDPVIAARYKALEQVRAEREEARRMHEVEIKHMLADWETARERLKRYWQELVPLSREAAAAALAAYRSGRGSLVAALEARRTAVETRFADVQTQAELARAWANLNFLVPENVAKKEVK